MKPKIANWIPAIFCACLSLICIAALLASSTGWMIPFLCFLPMSFFFTATVTSRLQREIRELREQVAQLSAQNKAS